MNAPNVLTASAGRGTTKRKAAAAVVAAMAVAGAGFAVSTDTIGAQSVGVTESEAEVFVALAPQRFLDTRTGLGADDVGPLDAKETMDVAFAGVSGVPDSATSVAINTTIPASSTSDEGFFTVWPKGDDRPTTSVNNANPGQPVPNFSLFQLGDDGALNVYLDRGEADFVIDVVGYFLPLSEVDTGSSTSTGGDLLSGSGAPDDSLGDDGDAYVDTDNGDLYTKANGEFELVGGASTAPTAATDSAIGAYGSTDVDLDLDDDDDGAIPFGDDDGSNDVTIGDDIERTDNDTFTVNTDGVYEVSYRVSTGSASDIGASVQVEVDGDTVGPQNAFGLAGTELSDTVLVEADAGDTIEVAAQATDDVIPGNVTLAAGDSTSITIELIATN